MINKIGEKLELGKTASEVPPDGGDFVIGVNVVGITMKTCIRCGASYPLIYAPLGWKHQDCETQRRDRMFLTTHTQPHRIGERKEADYGKS